MKVCKIITTVFVGRTVRENTTELGNPRGFFNHSQNFPTPDSVIDLLKMTIDLEKTVDPGMETDVIIVNNDIGYEKGNEYLKSINGTKIHSGIIKILTKDNFGRSFGGYNYAFGLLKDEYDYFIFTEDDILVNRSNYSQKAVNEFEKSKKTGAVAYQSISIEGLDGSFSKKNLHIHGGVCLSSSKVLSELYEKMGRKLPHCESSDSQRYEDIIVNGEIAFTHEIFNMGYELINMNEKLYDYAYDLMRGIQLEYT